MKTKVLFIASILLVMFFMIGSIVHAVGPSADILFDEDDLGEGLWRYNFTLSNTSLITTNDDLYGIVLYFDSMHSITNPLLPSGWDGIWDPGSIINGLEAHSVGAGISPGNSLSGFSFTINSQIGSVPFDARFLDPSGTRNEISGITSVAPEPISSVLFLAGGTTLAARGWMRRRGRDRGTKGSRHQG